MAANKLEADNLTRKGRGRPKGSPNKVSKEAKAVIAEAAEQLGGVERMVAWAKEAPENERSFWATIYPKLVAITVGNDPNNPLPNVTLVQLVAPNMPEPDLIEYSGHSTH